MGCSNMLKQQSRLWLCGAAAFMCVSSMAMAKPVHKGENHLLIPLPADETVGRQDVIYNCTVDNEKAGDDVRSLRTSLPAKPFTVTYYSADIMALAILPVDGRVMVFANVVAGDGAKYVADRYSWWSKGDEVTFAREDKEGTAFTCHVVPSGKSDKPTSSH